MATTNNETNVRPSAEPRVHRQADRLRRLADRLEQMDGPGLVGSDQRRLNDPARASRDGSAGDLSQEMIRFGLSGEQPTVLNLDQTWTPGGEVTGLSGVVLTTFPVEADAAGEQLRREGRAATPEAVTARVLELDAGEARSLADGPNHSGAARRWLTPEQAAEACRLTADGVRPHEVWPTVDRDVLHGAAATEKLTEHDEGIVDRRLEEWEKTEAQLDEGSGPSSMGEDRAQARDHARRSLVEQRLEEKVEHLVSPLAAIDPTARIDRQVGIGDGAVVGADAWVGAGTIIAHDARIGRDCTIGTGCTILKRSVIADETRIGGGTRIGPAAMVGTRCDLRDSLTIADEALVGDWTSIGPGTEIGADARIGGWVGIGSDCVVHEKALVGTGSTVGDNVVLGIGTRVGPDADLAHHVRTGWQCRVGPDARVGAAAVLEPYAEVGQGTRVPAHAVVKDSGPKPSPAVVRGAGRPAGGGTPPGEERGAGPARE